MSIRMTIMKLLEDGNITTEQANALLKQVELSRDLAEIQPGRNVNYVRVKLEDTRKNNVIVDNRLPVALIKLGLKVSRKVWADALERYPELKQFKVNFLQVWSRIERDKPGKVADLLSKDGSRRLEVWLD